MTLRPTEVVTAAAVEGIAKGDPMNAGTATSTPAASAALFYDSAQHRGIVIGHGLATPREKALQI